MSINITKYIPSLTFLNQFPVKEVVHPSPVAKHKPQLERNIKRTEIPNHRLCPRNYRRPCVPQKRAFSHVRLCGSRNASEISS